MKTSVRKVSRRSAAKRSRGRKTAQRKSAAKRSLAKGANLATKKSATKKSVASKAKTKARKRPSASLARAKREIAALKSELAVAEARIDELQAWADTDFLLNIYNRRGFERELDRALAYMRRYKASGALIVLDVDRLKPINDTFGHAAGDVVLKGVVALLMRHLRSSDVVGRLGGDEFGMLLWNLSETDALAKAAALEDAIDRLTFMFKGRSVVAGASAGVALVGAAATAAEVMVEADKAMYARKALRRGQRLAPVLGLAVV